MSGMWKRSHGRTSEAPPDERGGYRYVRPTATAPHLDSTQSHLSTANRARTVAPLRDLGRWGCRPAPLGRNLVLRRRCNLSFNPKIKTVILRNSPGGDAPTG